MKKLFQKYNIMLPIFAALYSIYMITKKITERWSYAPEMYIVEKISNGWALLLVIFTVLLAGILYSLRENRKWEYLYSFPVTKEQIYRETLMQIHRYTVVAGIIYAVACAIKYVEISEKESIFHIVLCCVTSVLFFWIKCIMVELFLLSFQRFWQGMLAAGVGLLSIWPILWGNIGYFLQAVFHISPNNIILQQVFYQTNDGLMMPIALNYMLISEGNYGSEQLLKHWRNWSDNYHVIMTVILCLCVIAMVGAVLISKRIFVKLDLSQKRIFTRMGTWENCILMTGVISLLVFNGVTNLLLGRDMIYEPEAILNWEIFFNKKQTLLSYSGMKISIDPMEVVMILVLSVLSTALVIAFVQAGRRKKHGK